MKNECYRKRPNCNDLLIDEHSWNLKDEDIKDVYISFCLEEDSNVFFIKFLKSKLKI